MSSCRVRLYVFASIMMVILFMFCTRPVSAFAYLYDLVTYVPTYDGSGGVLDLTVGVLPSSPLAAEMEISVRNTIFTLNALEPVESNIDTFGRPADELVDFETVLIHEMGHALGLNHVNLGSTSDVTGTDREYVMSTVGVNGVYDLDPGLDGVIGSADDIRGDDVNSHFFKIADNDPFTLPGSDVIDSTTYSKDLLMLPTGDLFAAKAGRNVGPLPRYNRPDAESIMNQQSYYDEIQRYLIADDVAALRFAMSGIDMLQDTTDDYIINLIYAGLTDTADIKISFNDSIASFAQTTAVSKNIDVGRRVVVEPSIYFNTNWNWYFNDQLLPEPDSILLFGLIFGVMVLKRSVQFR